MNKIRHRLAEALRDIAYRLDGQPTMTPADVMRNMQEHFGDMARKGHSIYMAQRAASHAGFWTPETCDCDEHDPMVN